MRFFLSFFLFLFLLSSQLFSQEGFIIQNRRKSDKIKFQLINNLVVIPVEINGVELSFLFDTGVSKPIIFNFLNVSDTLRIKNTEKIYLRGLGEGASVEALKSSNNIVRIGDAIKLNQELFAIFDANLNFAPRLGVPVHGIIGYDLLKDMIVEINYSNKYIRFTEPNIYKPKKCKKCEVFNLDFYNNKPYINTEVSIGNKKIPVKLLIDSGGSDALWLFEDDSLGIKSSNKYFEDFLGHGLSGSVYGKRSKLDAFYLKKFELKQVNVAFPDEESIFLARRFKDRNGSLAGNVLKRFNVIFDYKYGTISLKKNSLFKEKFTYNKSGIELAHDGFRFVNEKKDNSASVVYGTKDYINTSKIISESRYKILLKPAFAIVELQKDSPAEKAGLLTGDIILSINNKPSYTYTLQQLMDIFYQEIGKYIKLKVERNGKELTFNFRLEDPFK